MKLLIGFDDEAAINSIRKEFEKRGQRVEIIQKISKASVVEYVNMHFDCHMVLLMENHVQGKYTADELAKITDINEKLNVVLIADEARKGTAFLKQLYSAGIYGVIFQNIADKKGVSISKIVELLLHKRSKPEARQYYGIDEIAVEIESTPYYVLKRYYDIIRDGDNFGSNVGVRFFNITQQLSTPQNAELIKELPPDLYNQLQQYEEFYDVIQQIEDYGITTGIIRPRELKRAGVQVGRNLLGVDNRKDTNMEQMNFNQISGHFDNEQQSQQKNNYNSSAFNSMPLMRQSHTTGNVMNHGMENSYYQQPMLSEKEQASLRNNRQQYSSMKEHFSAEAANGCNGNKKLNSRKMMIVGGVVATVVLIFTIGAVSLLKNKPTVIAKEQSELLENNMETQSAVVTESDMIESEVSITGVEEDMTESMDYVSGTTEEEILSGEFEEMPIMDITSIIGDGSVVNQMVVDNIMAQYEDDYNFVVYGLPNNEGAVNDTPEEVAGDETEDDIVEEPAVEKIQDKYYRVSLNKPGSITFTEIAFN